MWRTVLIFICALHTNSGNPMKELSEEERGNLELHVRAVEGYYEEVKAKIEKRSSDGDSGSLIGTLSSQFTGGNTAPSAICPACSFLIGMMQGFIKENQTDDGIIQTAVFFCEQYASMPTDICQGLLQNNMPPLLYILRAKNFTSSEMCTVVVDQDCRQPDDPPNDWDIYLPPEDSKPTRNKIDEIPEDAQKLIVWHLSDTHLDLHYMENVSAECKLPLCCRNNSGEADSNSTASGPWGGWKCDTPKKTLENAFQQVKENHSTIDYIIWTGDVPAHNSWSITKSDSLLAFDETMSLLLEYFPETTVLYTMGNHEAVPMNMFPSSEVPEEHKIDWLYNAFSEKLSRWLPEEALATVRIGGYYTTLLRPKFRIISLNTNYCYAGNWWLALKSDDPAGQLAWLINILQNAERDGEKVHIIGHVPPGSSDCLKVWQRNYYKIVSRFADVIEGQFFGHTHYDEFGLYFKENDLEKVAGVEYRGCSLTPYTYLNPCYTILYIDGDRENSTRQVIDRESYYFDLDEANDIDSPVWTKLYSAREAYGMKSLAPKEWKSLYERLLTDDDLCDRYERHRWRNSPKTPPCNRQKLMCQIRSCAMYGSDTLPEMRNSDGSEKNNSTTTNNPDDTAVIDSPYVANNTESSEASNTESPTSTDSTDSTDFNTIDDRDGSGTTNNPEDATTVTSDNSDSTNPSEGTNAFDNSDSPGSTEPQTT